MKKEIIDRDLVLKTFSEALLLKNKIQSEKASMLEMYDDDGSLKPRYSFEAAAQLMEELERDMDAYEKALAEFRKCFTVPVKEYAEFVSDYIRDKYSVKSSVKNEKIPNTSCSVVKLGLKDAVPALGLEKKDSINLAVVDSKQSTEKTNILKSSYHSDAANVTIPLLHYRSEDSTLLVNEEKNEYSQRVFLEITKAFMEEKYLPSDYEVELE